MKEIEKGEKDAVCNYVYTCTCVSCSVHIHLQHHICTSTDMQGHETVCITVSFREGRTLPGSISRVLLSPYPCEWNL